MKKLFTSALLFLSIAIYCQSFTYDLVGKENKNKFTTETIKGIITVSDKLILIDKYKFKIMNAISTDNVTYYDCIYRNKLVKLHIAKLEKLQDDYVLVRYLTNGKLIYTLTIK